MLPPYQPRPAVPKGASAEPPVLLQALLGGADLDREESQHMFSRLVAGELGDGEIAALLLGLRHKGETTEELIGAVSALREAALRFPAPDSLFADCCGTGGDGSGSINVSTATGLVAAACGLKIVKHGNRSMSSRCGSADVLEAMGARLDPSPEQSARILEAAGFCFLLAPQYHPGLANAGPVRRMLGIRTMMNLLGPCCNPARPPVQLLGVADPAQLWPIARTLAAVGVDAGLVVHGSGLDEIALHGPTRAVRIEHGALREVELTPEEAGLERAPLERIAGGDVADNAARLSELLGGSGERANRDIVALNAGALLELAGLASSLAEGTAIAGRAIDDGAARATLDRFIAASNG